VEGVCGGWCFCDCYFDYEYCLEVMIEGDSCSIGRSLGSSSSYKELVKAAFYNVSGVWFVSGTGIIIVAEELLQLWFLEGSGGLVSFTFGYASPWSTTITDKLHTNKFENKLIIYR